MRSSVSMESHATTKRSLEAISNIVARLSCCPNGFCRIVYCSKCHQWYYTHSCVCWACRSEVGFQVLFKGCDSKQCPCFGDLERVKEVCENRKGEELFCGHKRRTAVTKELLIGLTVTIIGNLVANNWISELVDTRRSTIRMKISTLKQTKVITPVCSLNYLQNLNALGENELVEILKQYYSEIKTPQEMSAAPIQFMEKMIADDSIENLLKTLKITDEDVISTCKEKYRRYLLDQKTNVSLGETVKEDVLDSCQDCCLIIEEDSDTHLDNDLSGEGDEFGNEDEELLERQLGLYSSERIKAKQRKRREKKMRSDMLLMDTIMYVIFQTITYRDNMYSDNNDQIMGNKSKPKNKSRGKKKQKISNPQCRGNRRQSKKDNTVSDEEANQTEYTTEMYSENETDELTRREDSRLEKEMLQEEKHQRGNQNKGTSTNQATTPKLSKSQQVELKWVEKLWKLEFEDVHFDFFIKKDMQQKEKEHVNTIRSLFRVKKTGILLIII